MTTKLHFDTSCSVTIQVGPEAPEDWLSRVETDDFPYQGMSEREGLEMLVSCCIRLGVEDASRLDGWGDLERGMVTMSVDEHSVNVEADR